MAFYSKENVVIFKTDDAKKMKFKTESLGPSDSLDSGREKQSITPPAPERVCEYLLKNCTFFYK